MSMKTSPQPSSSSWTSTSSNHPQPTDNTNGIQESMVPDLLNPALGTTYRDCTAHIYTRSFGCFSFTRLARTSFTNHGEEHLFSTSDLILILEFADIHHRAGKAHK